MGLFDFLRKKEGGKPAAVSREIGRLERLVSNKLSQNFDRQDAIEQLGKIGSGEAAAVLLKRFNWYLDPSITDQDEKEATVDGIVNAQQAALEPIRQYCRRAESLTWPLKALERIVPKEQFVEELLTLLDQFDTEYIRNPEPKVQLLGALSAHPSETVRIAIEPFLEDASEPVRFAAVGTTLAMGQEEGAESLVMTLCREESLRIRNRILVGLADNRWKVPDGLMSDVLRALPPGFAIRDGQVIAS
jgi:HEAT repeat protein